MSTQSTDYRSIKAISNSVMGAYEDNFDDFAKYWVYNIPFQEKKEDALTMGSAIDTLLTRPDEFNDKFIIFPGNAPTGQMLTFCNALASKYKEGSDLKDLYQAAYDVVGFKRDKLPVVIEKFSGYKTYFDFVVNSKDKAVLSLEQAAKANTIVEQLTYGKYTRNVVVARTKKTETQDMEVFDQLEIEDVWVERVDETGEEIEVPIKGALDRVIVDHNRKVIIPVDFKSSYSVSNFEYSYFKWRYYRQGSFYTYLIKRWAEKKGWGDYEIKPFLFVVCSTTGGKHYMYKMTRVDLEAARVGGSLKNGQNIKGWEQILHEIAYMQHMKDWEYPYEAVVNDGIIPLNIFKYESNTTNANQEDR